ncbi:outer membrane autotransporter barrel domain-containing protein [Dyella sp. OK004]|uniref:Ig-like domain-containing protein n=1 Tax=Dyella sp. OK004 TaxID=1855292 RepID=UPI0008EABC10|nr:Ig-like domain-containing protein [Dyella sp. OK004]SFS20029.1 outer membrane autotransporter barrel domain-containing protein [Dyella sp. OK004]
MLERRGLGARLSRASLGICLRVIVFLMAALGCGTALAVPVATVNVVNSSLKAGDTSTVTFTFLKAVTGFNNSDIVVANGTLSNVSSADGGVTWTATLTPVDGINAVGNLITVNNTGISDVDGSGSGVSTSNSYAINTVRPTATVIVANSRLKIGSTSGVTITFSEAVAGFSNADLSISHGTLTGVSSSDGGITWTATFTPSNGIVAAANVITLDNSGVTNAAGNTGTGTTSSNNYAIDTQRPTATIVVANANLGIGATSLVTITFSEAVTGFSLAGMTTDNGTLSNLSTSDNITWTATLTPVPGLTHSGNVIVLDNTGVTDVAGNSGTGTTSSNNYTIDAQRPTAAIVLSDSALTTGKTALVTITFSEAVNAFSNAALSVSNATLSAFSPGNGGVTWTATLTPTPGVSSSSNVITLNNTAVTDLAGNAGTGTTTSANYTVQTGTQTITFPNPGAQNFGTSPTLTATTDAGLVPTFTSATTAVCTITPTGQLTFVSAGTCTIHADQAGNGTYPAAPTVTQSFSVNAVVPGAPTIGSATAGNTQATVTFTAPASNGGVAITGYTATAMPGGFTGTSSSNSITVTGLTNGTAYTFTVSATNGVGTGAASAASNSVTPMATQIISFANPGTQYLGTLPVLSATTDSGLTPTFSSGTTAVCTITAGGQLTLVSAGSCTIHADQPGNGNYLAAATVSQTFGVNTVVITVTPSALATSTVGVAYSQQLGASGGNGTYTYSVTSGALPAGLSLSASGVLSGTPKTAGRFNATVTATDSRGFTGSQAFTLVVADSAPVVVNDTASTPANAVATIAVTANDTGPITSIAIAQAPAHGTAVISGLNVSYTPAHDYYGSDSFTYIATGPGGSSTPATVTVKVTPLAVPVAQAQSVTVLAGKAVTIHGAQGATGGPFTTVNVIAPPSTGIVTVSGTDLIYTPAADATGAVSFDYTLSNAFGSSLPARVSITVNPLPVAPALSAGVLAGSSVQVDLTATAHGGPFTAASVVSISPANAGSASIHVTANGYALDFTAASSFSGVAQLNYTLSNAYATSAPGVVTLTVTARPDPSKDAEVLGILNAQVDSARRMAQGQIGNFQRRLESLHNDSRAGGFTNGITLTSASQQNRDPMQRLRGEGDTWSRRYLMQPDEPAAAPVGAANGSLPGGITVWTGGAVNFGKTQPGTSNNGIDFTTTGLSMGADKRINDALAVGAGLGYGHDASDIGRHGSRSTTDSYNLAFYASYHPAANLYVDGLLGYQWLSFDAKRYVTGDASLVTGQRDGTQWFGSVALGYEHRSSALLLSPYARLDVAHGRLDGYTESGVAGDTLSYQSQTVKTTTGNLGVRAQWTIKRDYGNWLPTLRAEYAHDFQGSGVAAMRYADLLAGPLYQASLQGQSRNRTLLGAGVQLQTLGGWMLRFEYQNLLENSSRDNQSVLLGVEKKFEP